MGEVEEIQAPTSKKSWINKVAKSDKKAINIVMYSALEPSDIVELQRINRYIIGVTPRKQKTFVLHLIKGDEKSVN